MKERATFVVDVLSEGAYLLAAPSDFDAKLIAKKWKENTTEIMLNWRDEVSKISDFSANNIELSFKSYVEKAIKNWPGFASI